MRRLALAVVAIFPSLAGAVPVTLDFTGTLTSYATANGGTSFDFSQIDSISDRSVSGSITFDLDGVAADASTSDTYSVAGFLSPQEFITSQFNWALGSLIVTQVPGALTFDHYLIAEDTFGLGDLFEISDYSSSDGFLVSNSQTNALTLSMRGPEIGGPGDTDVTPSALPDFTTVSTAQFAIGGFQSMVETNGSFQGFSGGFTIDSITVRGAQVPEPGTVLLFASGLLGLGLARRRRA